MLFQLIQKFAALLAMLFLCISGASAQPITPSKALSGPVGLEGSVLEPFLILVYTPLEWTLEEDYTYRDICIEGDEIRGSRFPGCIPHRRTKTYSPLDLSPWQMTNIQCEGAESCVMEQQEGPYLGPVYRGQENIQRYTNRLVQTAEDTSVDVCKRLIIPNNDVNPYDPVVARMELDSCTNQYILHRSDLPRIPIDNQGELPDIKEDSQLPGGVLNEFCQPLRMIPMAEDEQEYVPSQYYVEAWRKTMMDPEWLVRNGLAEKEPYYGALGIGLEEDMPIRDDYGIVNINDLAEEAPKYIQFERIYDPTHPFTPRWDFLYNERDHFSPLTVEYSKDPLNAVRCAGDKLVNIIKTDVLTWRKPSFELYMNWRIAFNILCYNIKIYGVDCFKLFDADEENPPCPTAYDGIEKAEIANYKLPDGYGTFTGSIQLRKLLCGPPHIEDLCEHITKPVAPANALKLREANEENFPFGVPQGYTFAQYFGDHRPYMRCWDTGLECGRDIDPVYGEGVVDPYLLDGTAGAEYAVMGAGREGESCTMGGGNGETVSQVDGEGDPIMDWMELKLYALRGMREVGINCLVKHEKVFKVGSGEELLANRAGGQYQKPTPDTQCELTRYSTFPWPLQWRGYITDPEEEFRYPNLGYGAAPLRGTGLDATRPGEILLFDESVVQAGAPGSWRVPYTAFVTEACNEAAECPPAPSHFVKAVAYNYGKFPDACAVTDNWFQGEEYTMYKGALPDYNADLFEAVGEHTTSCDDPANSFCTEQYWDTVKRYFPKDDQRR